MELSEYSQTLREPQLEPSEHCYTVLQDFGAEAGGWGPAAIVVPWELGPTPFVYTGSSDAVILALVDLVRKAAQDTGLATKLVRYTVREDIFTVLGSP